VGCDRTWGLVGRKGVACGMSRFPSVWIGTRGLVGRWRGKAVCLTMCNACQIG
jgi:hypothetical protein